MNRKQKTCLLVSIAAIVVMGLWPPWVIETRELNRLGDRFEYKYTLEPGPYSWIGSPPSRRKAYKEYQTAKEARYQEILTEYKRRYSNTTAFSDRKDLEARPRFIDLYRLGLQYFVVAVVTAGLIIILKNRKGSLTDGQKKESNNL